MSTAAYILLGYYTLIAILAVALIGQPGADGKPRSKGTAVFSVIVCLILMWLVTQV